MGVSSTVASSQPATMGPAAHPGGDHAQGAEHHRRRCGAGAQLVEQAVRTVRLTAPAPTVLTGTTRPESSHSDANSTPEPSAPVAAPTPPTGPPRGGGGRPSFAK